MITRVTVKLINVDPTTAGSYCCWGSGESTPGSASNYATYYVLRLATATYGGTDIYYEVVEFTVMVILAL